MTLLGLHSKARGVKSRINRGPGRVPSRHRDGFVGFGPSRLTWNSLAVAATPTGSRHHAGPGALGSATSASLGPHGSPRGGPGSPSLAARRGDSPSGDVAGPGRLHPAGRPSCLGGRGPGVDKLASGFQSPPAGFCASIQTPALSQGSLPPTAPTVALWRTLLSLNPPQPDSTCLVARPGTCGRTDCPGGCGPGLVRGPHRCLRRAASALGSWLSS